MEDLKLTDLVRKGTKAEFQYYRNSNLYYNIEVLSGDHLGEVYQICLSVGDFSSVDLGRTENSSIFMRWIRKALEDNILTKIN